MMQGGTAKVQFIEAEGFGLFVFYRSARDGYSTSNHVKVFRA
jgi:hypothetical protein